MSTETKYTPGPWVHNTDFRLYRKDDYSQIVAGPRGYYTQGQGFDIMACIKDADAKLIAAAPDLLEALKTLVDSWEFEKGQFYNPEINAAKAAIKKATE